MNSDEGLLLDAVGISAMLKLGGADLVHLWTSQDFGFPHPVQTDGGVRWARADIMKWAHAWRWRG